MEPATRPHLDLKAPRLVFSLLPASPEAGSATEGVAMCNLSSEPGTGGVTLTMVHDS